MLAQALLVFSSILGLAAAQSIDPSTVPLATRAQWCVGQQISCPLICLQLPNTTSATQSNTCDPKTLTFTCVCSNGLSPNASQYTQTIPYFICTTANQQCVVNCGNGNSACQSACNQDHPCGAQDPQKGNTSTVTTTMPATASSAATSTGGDVVYNGFGSAATSAPGKGFAPRGLVVEIGQVYGLFAVVAGLLGGAAVLL